MRRVVFIVTCPIEIEVKKNDEITMYKNPKGLYIAIKDGQEIGLVSSFSCTEEFTKEEIPTSLIGFVLRDCYNKEFEFIARI